MHINSPSLFPSRIYFLAQENFYVVFRQVREISALSSSSCQMQPDEIHVFLVPPCPPPAQEEYTISEVNPFGRAICRAVDPKCLIFECQMKSNIFSIFTLRHQKRTMAPLWESHGELWPNSATLVILAGNSKNLKTLMPFKDGQNLRMSPNLAL